MAIEVKHGASLHPNGMRGGKSVRIIDNTRDGLTDAEREEIANSAFQRPVFWNNRESFHWMFDFQSRGHWCEGVFRDDVYEQFGQATPYETLNVNVYE